MLAPGARDTLLRTLEAWIPRGSEVAIVDVPVHRNIGDLFILAATLRLLKRLQCRIVYRAGVRDYRRRSARAHIHSNTIVIGLGGGNFGDVYPRYLTLRERILQDFSRNRIVILPQTIHFDRAGERTRIVDRFSSHPDLRIAARDRASFEIARAITRHAVLLPDVVHALAEPDHIGTHATATRGTVFFMRQDAEKSRSSDRRAGSVDWPTVFPGFLPRLMAAAALMPVAPQPASRRLHDQWSRYADDLLSRGLSWMAGVEHLVTDRLHAAILARLARRPVTLHDNAYGKLTAYYDAWWRDDPAVKLLPTSFTRSHTSSERTRRLP